MSTPGIEPRRARSHALLNKNQLKQMPLHGNRTGARQVTGAFTIETLRFKNGKQIENIRKARIELVTGTL